MTCLVVPCTLPDVTNIVTAPSTGRGGGGGVLRAAAYLERLRSCGTAVGVERSDNGGCSSRIALKMSREQKVGNRAAGSTTKFWSRRRKNL